VSMTQAPLTANRLPADNYLSNPQRDECSIYKQRYRSEAESGDRPAGGIRRSDSPRGRRSLDVQCPPTQIRVPPPHLGPVQKSVWVLYSGLHNRRARACCVRFCLVPAKLNPSSSPGLGVGVWVVDPPRRPAPSPQAILAVSTIGLIKRG
jgi:hypothetical protein